MGTRSRMLQWGRAACGLAALFGSLPVASRVLLGTWGFPEAAELGFVCLCVGVYLEIRGRRRQSLADDATALQQALSLAAEGRSKDAVAVLTKALRVSPRLWQAYQYRGQIRLREPETWSEALAAWFQADRDKRRQAIGQAREAIRNLDPAIQAWACVSPEEAGGDGPLAAIPVGIKDVLETKELPTEYGSALYRGRRGTEDAALVRELRRAGAFVMGKTHTAAFAYRTPAVTRNPRNLEHTPGGSSSGSAAAVAAGMAPLAVGTQTLGSVLRPASYCGVTGFKPTFGLFSTEGLLTMSPSLDTLGFFTETAEDMLLLWQALGRSVDGAGPLTFGVPEPLPAAEPPMAEAFRGTLTALRSQGLRIEPLSIAPMLERLVEETRIVMFYEGARSHEGRYRQYGDRLLDLAELVTDGLRIPEGRYQEAIAYIADSKQRMAACYETAPVILAPAATGPAPQGLSSTGDPRMNSPWTAMGVPAISIPLPVNGLPLGLQLTAAHGQDARVLRAAAAVSRLL